jgi:hypothetical protein
MANGILVQNVPIVGTLCAGNTASRPSSTGLPDSFLYYDLTLAKPLWLFGGIWIDAAGGASGSAATGEMATTAIDHGLGQPAIGCIVTDVKNAILRYVPRITGSDNNTVRVWLAYAPLGTGTPTADVYVYC